MSLQEFSIKNTVIFREFGVLPYLYVLKKMHYFIEHRNVNSSDEIWFLQHTKTFTVGKSSKKEYFSNHFNNIPIIKSDRGGKITYHGPGQQIMYILLDLHRMNITVKRLIQILENIVITTLSRFSIKGITRKGMPGIYIGEKKICSIALAVKRGFCFHGIALNVKMDLSPFTYIDPCGYSGLQMTQISDIYIKINIEDVKLYLMKESIKHLHIISHIQEYNSL